MTIGVVINLTTPNSRLLMLARRSVPPTLTRHDVRRVVDGEHFHFRTMIRRAVDSDDHHDDLEVSVDLSVDIMSIKLQVRTGIVVFEARRGTWWIALLNDDDRLCSSTIIVTSTSSLSSDELAVEPKSTNEECRFDCWGKGKCVSGRCHCYSMYEGRYCEKCESTDVKPSIPTSWIQRSAPFCAAATASSPMEFAYATAIGEAPCASNEPICVSSLDATIAASVKMGVACVRRGGAATSASGRMRRVDRRHFMQRRSRRRP